MEEQLKTALKNLMAAAAMHDSVNAELLKNYKREGDAWEAWDKAWQEAEELLKQ